jgi:hypothetical protein
VPQVPAALASGDQAGVDDVADPPFQGPKSLFACSTFDSFPLVVGPAGAVGALELSDRGHVNGVVEPAVSPPGGR